MRRREAIIDPARVKRKEARGISRAGSGVQGMVACLAAGSPQRFVRCKDCTFGVVFSVN